MSTVKITDLETLANASDSDFLIVIDRSTSRSKKISRGEFLRGIGVEPDEIYALIDSDYLMSFIDSDYIKRHIDNDYIKTHIDSDYVLSFVDSDYIVARSPEFPNTSVLEFTAGENLVAGDTLVLNDNGEVVRVENFGPDIDEAAPVDLDTTAGIPHTVHYYNKFGGFLLYQSGYSLYAGRFDSNGSLEFGPELQTPFTEGIISVSADNINGNNFVVFGSPGTAYSGQIDSDLTITLNNSTSLNSYQGVENWGGEYNYSVFDENSGKYIWFSPGGGGEAYEPYQAVLTLNESTNQITDIQVTEGWDSDLGVTGNQPHPIYLPNSGIYVLFAEDSHDNNFKAYAGKVNNDTGLIEKADNAVTLFNSNSQLINIGAFRLGKESDKFIVYGNQRNFVPETGGWVDYDNDFFYQIITVNGLNDFTIGERHSLSLPNSFTSTAVGMSYDDNDDSVLLYWRSGHRNWRFQRGEVFDELITFSISQEIRSEDYGLAFSTSASADKFPDFVYHEGRRKIVTSTNVYSNDLFSLVFDNTQFRTTNYNFIGIADQDMAIQEKGNVVVQRGISEKVSGLEVGSSVYLSLNGNLTSTPTRYGVIGRALDSDRVLVTRAHGEDLASLTGVMVSEPAFNESLVYDGSKWVNKNFKDIGIVDSDQIQSIIEGTVTSSYLAENLPDIDAGSGVFIAAEEITAGDLVILKDDYTVAKPSSSGGVVSNPATDISVASVSNNNIYRNLSDGAFVTNYTLNDKDYLIIGSISPEGDVAFGVPYEISGNLCDIVSDGNNIVVITVEYNDGVYASLVDFSGSAISDIQAPVKIATLTNTMTQYEYHKPVPKAGYNSDNNSFAVFLTTEIATKFEIQDGAIVVPSAFSNVTVNGWVSNGGEVKYLPNYGFYVAIILNNKSANYDQYWYARDDNARRIQPVAFEDRNSSFYNLFETEVNHGVHQVSPLGSSPYFSVNQSNGNWFFYKVSITGEIGLFKTGTSAYDYDNYSYTMFAYDENNDDFLQKDHSNISLSWNQEPPRFPPGAAGGLNHLYRKFIVSSDDFVYNDFPTYIPGDRRGIFEYNPSVDLFVEGDYQSLNTVDTSSQSNVDKFIGFAADNIENGAFGTITLLGGINRNFTGLTPGPYYADFFGNVTPTPTEHGIVGVAINETTMLVNRPLNFSLKELDDVSVNGNRLQTGQVLSYSGNAWTNIDLPRSLTNQDVLNLINYEYIKGNVADIDIEHLKNVSAQSPRLDNVLAWNGSQWEPRKILDSADIDILTLDENEIKSFIDTEYLKETLPPIEAGYKLFEAKGSITAGQVVSLNDDGTVSEIVSDGEVTRNTQINFDATDDGVPLAQNLANEDVLFVYWSGTNSILVPGYVNVDGSVGVGDETESVPYEIKNIASNGSQFVLTYIDDNSNAYIIVGEAVGGIISSIDPPQQVTTVSTKNAACAYNSQTNSYVLSYVSGESSYAARLVFDSDLLVTVTHDTLLETPTYSYYQGYTSKLLSGSAFGKPSFIYNDEYNQLVAVHPMKGYLGAPWYDDTYHFAVLFIDDNGFEFSPAGESQRLPAFTANYSYKRIKDMSARIFNSHITIKWNNDYSGSTGRAIYSYTANSQVELIASNGSVGYYGYNSITQKFIDAGRTSYTEFYFDTQGDRIDEPFTTTGLSALPNNTNFIFNEHTGFIVEQLNASSVRTIDATIQTTVDDFIGISSENLADGETGSINVFAGINYHVDNLQRGEDYYVTATGELTTTPTDYGIVGKAIDTNAFIITRSAEPVLNDIGDVAISLATLSAGQVLTYTGNSWTNRTPFPPLTRLEVVDLIDNLSINAEGVQQLVNEDYVSGLAKVEEKINTIVDSDYVAVRATPTILSTIDSDYVSSKINLDEEVTAIINQHLGNQDSTGDDNPNDNGSGFIGSINQIIDERVDSVFLSPIVDSDYIVDRIDFHSIIDKDYIASKVDFDDFFVLDSANQDSNGTPQLTLTDEQIQRNIFTVVDSDYINSRITLDQLFNDTTGDSTSDSTGSFLTGINDLIDARVTSEYIAERFDIADFIASVPDLPVDTDPPN